MFCSLTEMRDSMDQVKDAVKALIAAVLDCEEYKRYQEAKKKIAGYPVLKQKADEYRIRKFELQGSGKEPSAEAEKLQKEYEIWLQEPVAGEYLDAESSFCRMLRHINWLLLESIDFEAGLDG